LLLNFNELSLIDVFTKHCLGQQKVVWGHQKEE